VAPSRRGLLACLLMSALLTLILGSGVLFAGRTFTPTDFLTTRPPWSGAHASDASLKNRNAQDILEFDAVQAVGAGESLRRGELFLWNPRMFCGWPAVGDPQLGTFYPPRLLLLRLLPPLRSLDLLILLQYLGAGVAMFALAREWGLRDAGAIVSSLTWLLCGPQAVWLKYAGGLTAALFLPLLALALHKGLAQRRLDWVAGAGALWALLFLGSHPQLSFLALAWTGACLAAELRRGGARWTLTAGGLFAMAGAGLAALQLFPFLESLASSQKAGLGGVGFIRPARVPLLLVTLFWQRAFGSPFDRLDLTNELTGDNFFNLQAYMGLLPLLLALAAWKRGRFLWIVALISLALATLYPLWWLVRTILPFLSVADPHRLYLFAFAISILAGLGAEDLLDRPPGRRLKLACALASAGVLLIGGIGALRSATWLSLTNPAFLALAIATLLTAAAVGVASSKAPNGLKTAALCAAILGDLLPGLLAYNPTYDSLPQEPEALARLSREDRVLIPLVTPYRRVEFGNFAAIYGCSTPEGYGSQYPRIYGELVAALGGTAEERRVRIGPDQNRLLRTLNVRQLLGADGFREFAALPRAWLVGKAERIDDPARRLHRLAEPSFDPGLAAVLEETPPPLEEKPVGGVDRTGPTAYRATCDRPCLLVISETHHPGWKATVDGRPERVLRVNHALRGLPLSPGTHTISFEFRPRSVSWGLACSGSTLLVLGVLFVVRARFERRIGGGFP
jgi:hypothetical protein